MEWGREEGEDVAPRSESAGGGAEQVGGAPHEHQRRQGAAGRAQEQPRSQGHNQDARGGGWGHQAHQGWQYSPQGDGDSCSHSLAFSISELAS